MATQVHPVDQASPTTVRMLGESIAVISSGAWFSAVTSAAFADSAAEAHDAGARELVLDLTGVRAVDAAGTATLGALSEQLEMAGCELAVAATQPGLVAWLVSVPPDLDLDLEVFETVDAALDGILRRPV